MIQVEWHSHHAALIGHWFHAALIGTHKNVHRLTDKWGVVRLSNLLIGLYDPNRTRTYLRAAHLARLSLQLDIMW